MNYVKIYAKPFKADLTYADDFIDITRDVEISSLGSINQRLDNDTYNVGTFKYSNFTFTVNNDEGLYSEPGVLKSIFINKRKDSIIKVTWSQSDLGPICGMAVCGESILGSEETVFYGLLNDTASHQNVKDAKVKFSVQGLESVFTSTETNYASLSVGDTLSTTIYKLLNQTRISDLMVVDSFNITCSIDQVPDSIASLEETTVKEAIDDLLEKTNSILYVNPSDQTVYVKPRTADAISSKTFHGQGSNTGSENIVALNKITAGINKTFNFWKWEGTTTTAKETSSIDTYGVRKRDVSDTLFTNTTKRGNILDDYRDEFGIPKQEMQLVTVLDYSTVALSILNKVNVNYPTIYYPAVDGLPRYGVTKYTQDRYPYGAWTLEIPVTTDFKILGKVINLKNGTASYDIREI